MITAGKAYSLNFLYCIQKPGRHNLQKLIFTIETQRELRYIVKACARHQLTLLIDCSNHSATTYQSEKTMVDVSLADSDQLLLLHRSLEKAAEIETKLVGKLTNLDPI